MAADPITTFLDAVTAASMGACRAFAEDVELDATVPNWRFSCRGADAVRDELGRWFADPGRFEELRRAPVAGGEVVEFTLTWEEGGVPHACHQLHVLAVHEGQIVSDRAWCGGRWGAGLLADMAAAGTVGA